MNQLTDYLSYLRKAKGPRKIHSPFVFSLLQNCIHDNKRYPEYLIVGDLYNKLCSDKTEIEFDDLGAGNKGRVRKTISEMAKNSSSYGNYGELLFRLVRVFKPKTILELGTSIGIGTHYLALGNKNARVITFEGSEPILKIAKKNFSKTGLQNVETISGNINETLPTFIDKSTFLDMVYFDANHRKESTLEYFELCCSLANNDSIFVLDDIRWSEGMKVAWNRIISDSRVTVSIDLFRIGLVFFRKEQQKEHFVLRF